MDVDLVTLWWMLTLLHHDKNGSCFPVKHNACRRAKLSFSALDSWVVTFYSAGEFKSLQTIGLRFELWEAPWDGMRTSMLFIALRCAFTLWYSGSSAIKNLSCLPVAGHLGHYIQLANWAEQQLSQEIGSEICMAKASLALSAFLPFLYVWRAALPTQFFLSFLFSFQHHIICALKPK